MTSTTWRTRLTRSAALATLALALTSTLATIPASAGPLDDLLAAIGTGSSGSSIPGPSAPPVGGTESFNFPISIGSLEFGDFFTAAVANPRCVAVTGTFFGEPISSSTRIGANYVTQWTVTRETTPECTNVDGYARIDFTNRDGRMESVYARIGQARCAREGMNCRDNGRNIVIS